MTNFIEIRINEVRNKNQENRQKDKLFFKNPNKIETGLLPDRA